MVVWARITAWGSEVFLHPRLAIRTDGTARPFSSVAWRVVSKANGSLQEFSVPLPSTRYEFAPIRLSKSLLNRLRSPEDLPLLSEPSPAAPVLGSVGPYFTRIGQDGNYAKVSARGLDKPGWLFVPALSETSTEFLDFTSGALKVLRHDWNGALAHFKRVAQVTNTSTAVSEDSKLLTALCLSQLGRDVEAVSILQEARERAWRSPSTERYLAMAYLVVISHGGEHVDAYRQQLRLLINVSLSNSGPYSAWWHTLNDFIGQQTEGKEKQGPESQATIGPDSGSHGSGNTAMPRQPQPIPRSDLEMNMPALIEALNWAFFMSFATWVSGSAYQTFSGRRVGFRALVPALTFGLLSSNLLAHKGSGLGTITAAQVITGLSIGWLYFLAAAGFASIMGTAIYQTEDSQPTLAPELAHVGIRSSWFGSKRRDTSLRMAR